MDAAVIVGNVAVITTSTNIGLVGVVEAGASELKLIVFIISSSFYMFLDLTNWYGLNYALFIGCTSKQLMFGVYTSLKGFNLIW